MLKSSMQPPLSIESTLILLCTVGFEANVVVGRRGRAINDSFRVQRANVFGEPAIIAASPLPFIVSGLLEETTENPDHLGKISPLCILSRGPRRLIHVDRTTIRLGDVTPPLDMTLARAGNWSFKVNSNHPDSNRPDLNRVGGQQLRTPLLRRNHNTLSLFDQARTNS